MKLRPDITFLFSSLVLNSSYGEELHIHMHPSTFVTYPALVSPHYTKEHKMIEIISGILHNLLILGIAITIWTVGIFFGVLTIFIIWEKYNE